MRGRGACRPGGGAPAPVGGSAGHQARRVLERSVSAGDDAASGREKRDRRAHGRGGVLERARAAQACSRGVSGGSRRGRRRGRASTVRRGPRAGGLRRPAVGGNAGGHLRGPRRRASARWDSNDRLLEGPARNPVSEERPTKRPGRLWLAFYGRPRRGFPWLLVGVFVAVLALCLAFAIPGGGAAPRGLAAAF